jgi:hypothetical protein
MVEEKGAKITICLSGKKIELKAALVIGMKEDSTFREIVESAVAKFNDSAFQKEIAEDLK